MATKRESYEEFKARLEKRGVYTASLETPEMRQEIEMVLEDFKAHNLPVSNINYHAGQISHSDSVLQAERILYWLDRVKTIGCKRFLLDLLLYNASRREFADRIISAAIREYRLASAPEHPLRNIAANLICVLADEKYIDELISLARNSEGQDLDEDKDWGMKERPHFIEFLAKFKKRPEVYPILLEILNDHRVRHSAIIALGKYGNPEALPMLEKYVNDPDSDIRRLTKAAIKRLEKFKKP